MLLSLPSMLFCLHQGAVLTCFFGVQWSLVLNCSYQKTVYPFCLTNPHNLLPFWSPITLHYISLLSLTLPLLSFDTPFIYFSFYNVPTSHTLLFYSPFHITTHLQLHYTQLELYNNETIIIVITQPIIHPQPTSVYFVQATFIIYPPSSYFILHLLLFDPYVQI